LETGAAAAGPVHELCEQVAAAQGLLIATPEYNHSVPGVLKNAIDWLSRPSAGAVLAGKPVAVVGASGGRRGTRLAQAAVRQALFATESLLVTAPARPGRTEIVDAYPVNGSGESRILYR